MIDDAAARRGAQGREKCRTEGDVARGSAARPASFVRLSFSPASFSSPPGARLPGGEGPKRRTNADSVAAAI